MGEWLLRFLVCALVAVVVVYVVYLVLGMIVLPEPAKTIILLIVAVAVILAMGRYLGWPPSAAVLLALLAGDPVAAGPEAVIRVPSHGSSATIVWTGPGRSLILSCAHGFEQSRNAIVLDVPSPAPGAPYRGGLRLLGIDHRADLSLIELGAGPLPYVAAVAASGHRLGRCLSVGYDEMRLPAVVQPVTVLRVDPETTWTREPPWHGRSGGALLDADTGELLGVVSGYTGGNRPDKGIYVSHGAILRFLIRQGWRPAQAPWVSEQLSFWRQP